MHIAIYYIAMFSERSQANRLRSVLTQIGAKRTRLSLIGDQHRTCAGGHSCERRKEINYNHMIYGRAQRSMAIRIDFVWLTANRYRRSVCSREATMRKRPL